MEITLTIHYFLDNGKHDETRKYGVCYNNVRKRIRQTLANNHANLQTSQTDHACDNDCKTLKN